MTLVEKLQEIKAFIAYNPEEPERALRADYLASTLDSLLEVQLEMARKIDALEQGYRRI